MAQRVKSRGPTPERKPVVWLHGEIKTPPFTEAGRWEAGELLRALQQGEMPSMPHAEPLPVVGPGCGSLRVRDGGHNWRIVYRLDADAVIVLEVYAKKTARIPQEIIGRCRRRLRDYDAAAETSDVSRKSRRRATD